VKAPTTEAEALHQLAEDLRRDRRRAAAAIVDAGYRELAGQLVAELAECAPSDRVTLAMVRAWGARNDAAVLAGYQSLHAFDSDGDEDVALAVMAATPATPAAEPVAAVAIPDDLDALAQYELTFHCRAVGLHGAARLAASASTRAEWRAVAEALRQGGCVPEDEARWEGVVRLAQLAHVSPTTWLSTTRSMIETDAAATAIAGAAS
jgi:hypothetical protein